MTEARSGERATQSPLRVPEEGKRLTLAASYDVIGVNYAELRKPDPRIAAAIDDALGSAETVLNVGAGTGSYEPPQRTVTAVEPSTAMIRQRAASAAPALRASAENLPFPDKSFDAAMAILTVHHWPDKERGIREMRRVARGPVVILTFDPEATDFWLFDYFPEFLKLDRAAMPKMTELSAWLGEATISPLPVPHDCTDGFLCAYWRRPEAYLDERIRSGMSPFWAIDDASPGLDRLSRDLSTGAWSARHSHLADHENCDVGYRLVVGS